MTLTMYADVEQRSPEWHDLRRGTLTASTIGALLTPTLRVADNDTSRAATNALIAERITGVTEPGFFNADMERGILHEPYAVEAYQARTGSKVTACGFMVREGDGWTVGFSPDGLVDDDGLIEIKCPRARGHIQTIVSGQIPTTYMAQLQTGLFVSGRNWIDYVSFYGGLPLFIKRVTPDRDWQEAITYAATKFETDATTLTAAYRAATNGQPNTNRVPTFEDIT